jgi:hypothetical protein
MTHDPGEREEIRYKIYSHKNVSPLLNYTGRYRTECCVLQAVLEPCGGGGFQWPRSKTDPFMAALL